MKAAVLTKLDTPPSFTEFADPTASEGQVLVTVTAAGVHHVDLARASGYPAAPPLPCVLGTDGVGRTEDGRRVFFQANVEPYGSWAQRTVVHEENLLEIATDVDDRTAAALANTGLAAWLALSWSARLRPGESVLVLGATGAVGSVAVQAAKAQGAGYVIAADRNPERLAKARERGADATVLLTGDDLSTAFQEAAGPHGIDVIIDPLWGEPALEAMRAASKYARHIEIGNAAAPMINLPAQILRLKALQIIGFAIFNAPLEKQREAYLQLTELVARGDIAVEVISVPLADVASAWERQKKGAPAKLVLTP
jgi:NADPH:quinone reductase-like Zn-dependent oxidoreductase